MRGQVVKISPKCHEKTEVTELDNHWKIKGESKEGTAMGERYLNTQQTMWPGENQVFELIGDIKDRTRWRSMIFNNVMYGTQRIYAEPPRVVRWWNPPPQSRLIY